MKKKHEQENDNTDKIPHDLNWAQAEASLPRLDNPAQDPAEDTTGQVGGIKPRASGRQGSIDVQDGGQDVGSSAGSH